MSIYANLMHNAAKLSNSRAKNGNFKAQNAWYAVSAEKSGFKMHKAAIRKITQNIATKCNITLVKRK